MAQFTTWPASDLPLAQRVRNHLDGNGSGTFRGVIVEADGGTVTLAGFVGSFYAKQLAQEFARRTAGVIAVINHIEVTDYVAAAVKSIVVSSLEELSHKLKSLVTTAHEARTLAVVGLET